MEQRLDDFVVEDRNSFLQTQMRIISFSLSTLHKTFLKGELKRDKNINCIHIQVVNKILNILITKVFVLHLLCKYEMNAERNDIGRQSL